MRYLLISSAFIASSFALNVSAQQTILPAVDLTTELSAEQINIVGSALKQVCAPFASHGPLTAEGCSYSLGMNYLFYQAKADIENCEQFGVTPDKLVDCIAYSLATRLARLDLTQ